MLHHFGSKAEMIVAATHHIADIRLARIQDIAVHADGEPDALRRVVRAFRESMTGPPFQAAMELWTASRTDPALRAALLPAEHRLGEALRSVFDQVSGINDACARSFWRVPTSSCARPVPTNSLFGSWPGI
ncbi:hypothetical protein [Micromonospora sp. SH-82]|uniref:hypothetical protein n=1 Tax=Micromonospora sp. SH-82 TaxID=3132938 RepID=UPI003EBFD6C8